MEPVETLCEGEWSSLSGMFSTKEAELMAQLLGNYPFPNEQDGGSSLGTSSTFWPTHEDVTNMMGNDENLYCSFDTVNSNLCYFPPGSSYSSDTGSLFLPTLGHENYYLSDPNPILVTNNCSLSMDFCMVDESTIQIFPDKLMEVGVCLNEEISSDNVGVCLNEEISSDNLGDYGGNQPEAVALPDKKLNLKRKSEKAELDTDREAKANTIAFENSKKKSRVSDVQKHKKNVQSKKNQKLAPGSIDEEENNGGQNRLSSNSDCSEDDSNASLELNTGVTSSSKGSAALNLNEKTRASRGSATDPQSLYARKRRERINERLRILQNLVPNGTKAGTVLHDTVDISTMLEEAVQYVKFLQLQIKLLSSDDLWMYAPIAFNGLDLGLDLKISQPQ
ncbi:hypothetical protein HHK36_002732 [Tetracentron sinense]|uniref:BHLH domain-containing protein n=1 Tax=Tetracentron sinense TaxID=13715 RepID=A0A834ZMQ1_TETSI|nr:hypothetical protein HHK36_002732 [Tetracentron sinense]